MITVKSLMEELKKLPQDSFIIMQKDGEGNGYSPMAGVDEAYYQPTSTWSGEMVSEDLEDYEDEEQMEEEKKSALRVVVLWPVN